MPNIDDSPRDEKETSRVEAFSDGVFAIAMTLLVLDIKVPHASDLVGEKPWAVARCNFECAAVVC
jgi:uncharacterized membrane protein